MLIFYHMNYLNPYIALGGRNPFRACFCLNHFLDVRVETQKFILKLTALFFRREILVALLQPLMSLEICLSVCPVSIYLILFLNIDIWESSGVINLSGVIK